MFLHTAGNKKSTVQLLFVGLAVEVVGCLNRDSKKNSFFGIFLVVAEKKGMNASHYTEYFVIFYVRFG